MSGHTSTAAGGPRRGRDEVRVAVPSGVVMVTLLSLTSTAHAARGSTIATPTAAAIVPTSRREYFLRSSAKWSWSHMACFPSGLLLERRTSVAYADYIPELISLDRGKRLFVELAKLEAQHLAVSSPCCSRGIRS